MLQRAQKFTMAVAAVFAIAVGSAVIANAASSGSATAGSSSAAADSGTTGQQGARPPGGPGRGETPLTGDTADKVTAAAKAKVPGGTVLRVETDAGDAAYEAHVRKSDGTEVIVLVNKDFEVTDAREAAPVARAAAAAVPVTETATATPTPEARGPVRARTRARASATPARRARSNPSAPPIRRTKPGARAGLRFRCRDKWDIDDLDASPQRS